MGQEQQTVYEAPYSVYCEVHFNNRIPGLTLKEPRVFYESGDIYVERKSIFYDSLPDGVDENRDIGYRWCFKKTGYCATGSLGVFTYKIGGKGKFASTNKYLQIMWAAPYNQDTHDNWVGIGVGGQAASEQTFNMLYQGQGFENYRRQISKSPSPYERLVYYNFELGIVVRAKMTSKHQADLEVHVEEIRENPGEIFMERLRELIKTNSEVIKYLVEFVKKMIAHEAVVNGANLGAGIGTIIGVGLLATPAAPLSAAYCAVNGGIAIATTVGDAIVTAVKRSNLQMAIDKVTMARQDYIEIREFFQLICVDMTKKANVYVSEANAVSQGVTAYIQNGPKCSSLDDYKNYFLRNAVVVQAFTTTGQVIYLASFAWKTAPKAVNTATKVLGVISKYTPFFNAITSVASLYFAIRNWDKASPTRLKAEQALEQVRDLDAKMREFLLKQEDLNNTK